MTISGIRTDLLGGLNAPGSAENPLGPTDDRNPALTVNWWQSDTEPAGFVVGDILIVPA